MIELKKKILTVLNKHPLVNLATVTTDSKPWVRYVMTKTNKDIIIRTAVFAKSRKIDQIKSNPEVHICCGINDLSKDTEYLQIQARAEISDEMKEKEKYWSDMLKMYFQGPSDPNYVVLIIKPYRIEYWGMGKMEPEIYEL